MLSYSDEEHILNLDELVELCDYWQEVLGLQDWDIALKISRATEFSMPFNCLGECSWNIATATAYINILDDIDYPKECAFKHDMEKTLVHELLHLLVGTFDISEKESTEHDYMERTVVKLSSALVSLKRKGIE